jgi:hypothetical protein
VTDWATISSLATGGGTLVLAIATFGAVRSANRAARVAESSLLAGLRPLLVCSLLTDPYQKVFYGDGKYEKLEGGRGLADLDEAGQEPRIYLAISVRNAGRGIAVLHGWRFSVGRQLEPSRPDLDSFRPHSRDIYIAPSDVGFWQAAFRDPADPQYDEAVAAVKTNEVLTIDVLYGDSEGGQRAISRFNIQRPTESSPWLASVVRHWNVDRPDPRDR